MSKLAICCLLLWLSIGGLVALLLGQHHAGVLHPAYVPLLLLLIAIALLLIATVVVVTFRLLSGNKRFAAIGWLLLAVIPVLLLANCFVYAKREWADRRVPGGIRGMIAFTGGASLMEAQAAHFYPNRVESVHIMMFYRDLSDPAGDLAIMEAHVSELEQYFGRPMREKIHWVRGPLVGQRNLSVLGLALGSDRSYRDSPHAGIIDCHELAHAVLTQYRAPSADPPMLLHEGWAQAHSGFDSKTLAREALEARSLHRDVRLVDLLMPDRYRIDAGLAYPYGGAFVDFLLRNYSVAQFVAIYNQWRVQTSDQHFRDVYGLSLEELEENFWREAASLAG